jgi:hypothetical protein
MVNLRARSRHDALVRPARFDPAHDDERDSAQHSQNESDAHPAIVGRLGSDPAQDGSSGFAYWTSIGFGG